jgi:predicted site-specific integrase-resolvase
MQDTALRSPTVKRLYSLQEAAQYLGITPEALRWNARKGRIPVVRWDLKLRFDLRDLDKMIDENKGAL